MNVPLRCSPVRHPTLLAITAVAVRTGVPPLRSVRPGAFTPSPVSSMRVSAFALDANDTGPAPAARSERSVPKHDAEQVETGEESA